MNKLEITNTLLLAPDKIAAITDVLTEMLCRAADTAKTLEKPASRVAVFRQGFQTWRAACATLTAKDPESFPDVLVDLYPSLLCDISVGLFALCLEYRAFIGFEPSPEQASAVLAFGRKPEAEERARREAQARRFLAGHFAKQHAARR